MANKRNNNTISGGMFIFKSVISGITAMFMYRVILLRCVGSLDYFESIDAFCTLMGVFALFGFAVSCGKHRNAISVFINTVTPLELFTVASYYRTVPVLIWSFVALAVVLSLGIREPNQHALKALFSLSSGVFLFAIRRVLLRRRNTRLQKN